eukprot:525023-Amphidinium_carterae.1
MSTCRACCAGAASGARRAGCANRHRGFACKARADGAGTDACDCPGRGCAACAHLATRSR